MIEIRIHGRGGQGAVIASKALASAAFKEGKYAQAFPAFGVERRGAPVAAFTRVDDHVIRLRSEIYEPDHLIVLDTTLLNAIDVTAGLKEGAWILLNTDRDPREFKLPEKYHVAAVDASAIAAKYHLGPRNAPIVNTAILGAFARIADVVGLEAILDAVREAVPSDQDGNIAATKEAFDMVRA